MTADNVVLEAHFDPRLKTYLALNNILVCVFTVIGIPLIPLFVVLAQKEYENLSCVLTDRSLVVKRGVLIRREKTIPLDKIQDLSVSEGPLLRYFGLCTLKVETAGQSAGPGMADANLAGLVDAMAFRDRVFAQREACSDGSPAVAQTPSSVEGSSEQVLIEIRDALLRIEERLQKDA